MAALRTFQTPDRTSTRNDAEVLILAPIAPDLIRDVTVAHARGQAVTKAAMRTAGRLFPIPVFPDIFIPE